jgi:hypothetical protein
MRSFLDGNEFVANTYVIGGTYFQGTLSIRLQVLGNTAKERLLRMNAEDW